MTARPRVLLSVAASLDGYIDDASTQRLLLSNSADLDRVDQVRADSDAILVGAQTLRTDNPRLLVNSAERRAARGAAGKPEYPVKVTVTDSGELDPELRFWHTGGGKLVYTSESGAARLRGRLDSSAEVVVLGSRLALPALLDDLGARGVERLMVEGGTGMHTGFLAADLVDEIRLAIAPILVGDPAAPRFVAPARFPGGAQRRLRLAGVEQLGDVAVLNYLVDRSTEPENYV
ncbi:deaminase [Nocardia mangyaensis]|uniref:Deaminase n=1 Tax=Nocardia mangyaensis TaxID=2213200 RepID=A0A1J0VKW5_9NOCA|nr:dihydrofolate reductase family protein [Nocardia mangyaensis]APE32645.1 deaminase [Nocardia mangyaensis]